MSVPRVVVFSPSDYSLYTLCVVEKLVRAGMAVTGICARRLLSPQRLWREYRRERSRLVEKVWRKLVRRERTFHGRPNPWALYLEKLRPPTKNVSGLARHHGIPLLFCATLNDAEVLEFLQRRQPELVVFTGGGILRRPVLERAGRGVVNCHMGILPDYRGMNVVEWALLEGRPDLLGLSVHLMDEGIDTGPLLSVRPIALEPDDISLARLVERLEPLMCEEIVDASVRFLRGEITPRSQHREDGKQYFRMPPALRKQVEKKLAVYVERLAARGSSSAFAAVSSSLSPDRREKVGL